MSFKKKFVDLFFETHDYSKSVPGPKDLYPIVIEESIRYGAALGDTLPGYGSAYYVQDLITRKTGIKRPFGKYTVPGHPGVGGPGTGNQASTDKYIRHAMDVFTGHSPIIRQASRAYQDSSARSGLSAHGGRRSGTKPRKKCPKGFRWDAKKKRCVPIRGMHSAMRSSYHGY